ncbi:3-hydroxyisobutyrate dehydrogenase-like beta-hydroxyacid dehydrogenase [Bradyrhizobium sp. i1.7.7]
MADASKTNPQGVERLGYLGLGLMGTPMTRRLLKAGHQVAVWNRSEGKVAPLVVRPAPSAQPRPATCWRTRISSSCA